MTRYGTETPPFIIDKANTHPNYKLWLLRPRMTRPDIDFS
jgi:hypothetical protein